MLSKRVKLRVTHTSDIPTNLMSKHSSQLSSHHLLSNRRRPPDVSLMPEEVPIPSNKPLGAVHSSAQHFAHYPWPSGLLLCSLGRLHCLALRLGASNQPLLELLTGEHLIRRGEHLDWYASESEQGTHHLECMREEHLESSGARARIRVWIRVGTPQRGTRRASRGSS